MRDRISQAEIDSFANAAIELWQETGYPFVTMHETVARVWVGSTADVKLPPAATQDYYRKIPAVRKQLIVTKGCMVAPVTADYPRAIRARVFDPVRCLPSRGAPQEGFLFIDEKSSDRDLEIWSMWLKSERQVSNARGSEAAESTALAKQDEALALRPAVRSVLVVEGAS